MNKAKYEALPGDLRAIVDAESGAKLSGMAAQVMWYMDAPGRAIAEKAGNTIVQLDATEVARCKDAAQPVIARLVEEIKGKYIDGQALIDQATALINK